MLRKFQLLLVLVLLIGTSETGIRASTDCQRWVSAYRAELAHAKTIRRIQAAKARMKRAAQKKLATYVRKPAAPKLMRAHFVRPKYTRQQMLDRFNILCGELPGENKPVDKLLDGKMTPVEFASEMSPFVPEELEGPSDDGSLIASNETPTYGAPGMGGSSGGGAPSGGSVGSPVYPGGGGGGGVVGKTPPDTPVVPVVPVVGEVPEPQSVVLLLTGMAGAAGMIRRRFQA